MLEILQFIFSSFWTWAGTVILLVAASNAAYSILVALCGKVFKVG